MARILLSSIIICLMLLLTKAWNFNDDVSKNHTVVRRNVNIDYTEIIDFWQEHKNELVLHKEHKEVVLMMGNTGAGRTTLISALVGRKLRVIEQDDNLVFVDAEDRIGTGVLSKTLIPEAMIDRENNVTYIDSSGFRDNRGFEYEIFSIYFQNILLNQIDKIKLILVINYESLKKNGNKNDFDDLFEHIGEFIKDISKFHDGIALVATKVRNRYQENDNGTYVLTNDNQSVLEGMANYLKDKRDVYRSKTENRDKYMMFVNLIDALLEKKDNSYTKIAIFRKPTRQGLLENLEATNKEINAINEMILENLHYVKKNRDDFSFALSKASKNTVNQIVTDIFRDTLTNRLNKMSNETLMHYSQIEKQYSDIEILLEQVSRGFDVISRVKNANEPIELFREFLNAANYLNISVSLTNLNIISEDIKALKFFTTLSDINGDMHMLLLKDGMQNVIDSIEKLKNFYEFLNNLQTNLASYRAQNLNNDKRIGNIMRSCVSSNSEAIQNIMDLESIAKEIGSDEIYGKIKTLVINQSQLKHIKSVFDAFSGQLEFSCPSPSEPMMVKGYNVKISDVVKIECWSQAKNIQVFALNKVFIDCTIDKTGAEAQLFIFAPTWEIIGEPKIILDGIEGKPHDNTHAKSSSLYSENGMHGLPGLPGGPAGHFFGVGEEFINAEYLEIQANGGKGGPGQHGGNGTNGIAGEELSHLFFEIKQEPKDAMQYLEDHGHKYILYLNTTKEAIMLSEIESALVLPNMRRQKFYLRSIYQADVSGKPATKPTDGGNGGVGGRGGYPGKIIINGLGKLVNVKTSNNPGSSGAVGQGGHGGEETSDGRRVKFICQILYTDFDFYSTYKNMTWIDGAIIPAGKDGKPGINEGDQKSPLNASMASPYSAINSFKDFLRTNLFENVKESELRNLITKIDNDKQIKAQYNTLAFVEEFGRFLRGNQFDKIRQK